MSKTLGWMHVCVKGERWLPLGQTYCPVCFGWREGTQRPNLQDLVGWRYA